MKPLDIRQVCIPPSATIREAAACIDRATRGIALVTDGERRLLATVTDGDVRRAMLAGIGLDAPLAELLAHKQAAPSSAYREPVTAPLGTDRSTLLHLMRERQVRQVPLIDHEGRVASLVTLDELLPEPVLPLEGVIMAGGFGSRLRPLTDDLPKPMLPVGDRPLLERIIEQMRRAGIRRVNITTHYLSEKITSYFGDGHALGVELHYVTEDSPLGTAGALSLMEPSNEPLLVINGDILTRVDFRSMLAFHREYGADLTVAVRPIEMQVPYGVAECDGPYLRRLTEKPAFTYLVNAGIYLLEPTVRRFVPAGRRFDMTDLIQRLLETGRIVANFPILEYWLDIGKHGDYAQAQEDVKAWHDLENGIGIELGR